MTDTIEVVEEVTLVVEVVDVGPQGPASGPESDPVAVPMIEQEAIDRAAADESLQSQLDDFDIDPATVAQAIAADPDLAGQIVSAVSDVATDSEVASAIAAAIAAHAAGDASDAELAAAVATLNTALGGKAALSHTHAQSDVTGLTAALAAKVATRTYLDVALEDSPAALWAHNETSGATSTDLSGNGNHGTYTGGYTLNQTGGINGQKATLLNGSSGYVTVPDANSLDLTTTACLETWVKPATAGGTGERGLISKGGGSGYLLALYQSGALSRFASSGPNNQGVTLLDQWNLVGVEWNGAYIDHYLNGDFVSRTGAAVTITPGSAALLIGQSGGLNWLNGLIGPAAVYNHCIGPMRHARHWMAGVGGF